METTKNTQPKTPEQITKMETKTNKTPETEYREKVSRLQGEILDSCYKAQEIGKALEYLLTCPPEYKDFDPCVMAQSVLDYLGQIERKAQEMTFKGERG